MSCEDRWLVSWSLSLGFVSHISYGFLAFSFTSLHVENCRRTSVPRDQSLIFYEFILTLHVEIILRRDHTYTQTAYNNSYRLSVPTLPTLPSSLPPGVVGYSPSDHSSWVLYLASDYHYHNLPSYLQRRQVYLLLLIRDDVTICNWN